MNLNCRSSEHLGIALPSEIEYALRRVVKHYWNPEQREHARLPEHERIGHIFESIRLLDDWLFEPTGIVSSNR